jgi:hypothetical protein
VQGPWPSLLKDLVCLPVSRPSNGRSGRPAKQCDGMPRVHLFHYQRHRLTEASVERSSYEQESLPRGSLKYYRARVDFDGIHWARGRDGP